MGLSWAHAIMSYRKRERVTQEQLAERAEVDIATINRIENGRTRKPSPLVRKQLEGLGIKGESATNQGG